MPSWAWGYILLCAGLFTLSVSSEKTRNKNELISSVFSLICICVFTLGFFNAFIANILGYLVIPMACVGIYWEFTRAIIETKLAEEELEKEGDLSEGERSALLNLAIGFNALIVVPGYVMGLMLSFRVLGLL